MVDTNNSLTMKQKPSEESDIITRIALLPATIIFIAMSVMCIIGEYGAISATDIDIEYVCELEKAKFELNRYTPHPGIPIAHDWKEYAAFYRDQIVSIKTEYDKNRRGESLSDLTLIAISSIYCRYIDPLKASESLSTLNYGLLLQYNIASFGVTLICALIAGLIFAAIGMIVAPIIISNRKKPHNQHPSAPVQQSVNSTNNKMSWRKSFSISAFIVSFVFSVGGIYTNIILPSYTELQNYSLKRWEIVMVYFFPSYMEKYYKGTIKGFYICLSNEKRSGSKEYTVNFRNICIGRESVLIPNVASSRYNYTYRDFDVGQFKPIGTSLNFSIENTSTESNDQYVVTGLIFTATNEKLRDSNGNPVKFTYVFNNLWIPPSGTDNLVVTEDNLKILPGWEAVDAKSRLEARANIQFRGQQRVIFKDSTAYTISSVSGLAY